MPQSVLPNRTNSLGDPFLPESVSRRLLVGLFVLVLVIQGFYLARMGNGVGKYSDGFSESNALRAAQAYIDQGLTSSHGLPHEAYGTRFPAEGFLGLETDKTDGAMFPYLWRCFPPRYADHDVWVYTHYPEGPDVILALLGHVFGLDHPRLLRLFPLGCGLIAVAVFFSTLAQTFGAGRATVIAAGCVALPLFHTHMPGLHFQGYALALLLLQISLLLRMYFGEGNIPKWNWAAQFLLGFLQGWLSFDFFFVVGMVAWPLWLLARSEEKRPSTRTLVFCMALPVLGFGAAHTLHFLQVAGETGSLQSAVTEFRTTALERGGTEDMTAPEKRKSGEGFRYWATHPVRYVLKVSPSHYVHNLASSIACYLIYSFQPGYLQCAPVLPIVTLLLLPFALFRPFQVTLWQSKRSGPVTLAFAKPQGKGFFTVLGAAFFVSVIWLLVMPGHVANNCHVTIRHFFIFYMFALIALSKGMRLCRNQCGDTGTASL